VSQSAAIFTGQGAQSVGMGQDVAERFAAARDTFAAADEVVGFPLSSLCFEGPAERLNATDIQQPAIFTTSVAIFRAACDAGVIRADGFQILGGLSLGEYTALHLAGALSFEDALRLVKRRGELMQQAAEAAPGGMVSLLGMDAEKVDELCRAVAAHGRIGAANFNCPGQIVISGDRAAAEAAAAAAAEFGGRAIPLPVAGAFHSELMRPAAEALRAELAQVEIRAPRARVLANVSADYHGGPDAIRDSLYRQVTSPVRWQACVERAVRDGASRFTEFGPGRVLTGFMKKIDRSIECTNLGKVADLTPAAV